MSKILDDDFNESELFSADVVSALPMKDENPLSDYFRLPGVNTGIPTRGRFLPKGSIEFDDQGLLEVYPMTSADELLLKAPDALMSGLAVEKLLESCVPGLKRPSLLAAPDLDVLLIAIRAATYGNIMPVEVECPKCEEELAFDCDLSAILATMTEIPENLDLRLSKDVVVVMKPHTMKEQTRLLLSAYDEQRRVQNIDEDELNEEQRAELYTDTLRRFSDFQAKSLTNGIVKMVVPKGEVTDRKHIEEFIRKTTKQWSGAIQKKLEEINTMGLDRNLPVTCKKCKHEWSTKLEFNPATFFEASS